jgi:hypothetical protein
MARAKPSDTPADRTRQVQLIDLENHYSNPDGTLTRNKKKVDRGEQCYFASPMDFPAYVRFTRTVENWKEGTTTTGDHLSTTAELDLYPAGVRIFVKYDRKKKQFVLMKQVGDEKAVVIERFAA